MRKIIIVIIAVLVLGWVNCESYDCGYDRGRQEANDWAKPPKPGQDLRLPPPKHHYPLIDW